MENKCKDCEHCKVISDGIWHDEWTCKLDDYDYFLEDWKKKIICPDFKERSEDDRR